MSEHTNMITCSAGGDAASAMARTAVLEIAEGPSRDGNDQLGPQLRRVSLQMRNAQRRRCSTVPNSGDSQFELSPKHKHKRQKAAGICFQSEDQKRPWISLFDPGGAGWHT